jgi:outer membrane protein insertion porin family
MDVGAVWGIRRPVTDGSTVDQFIPTRDPASGQPLYTQIDAVSTDGNCAATTTSQTTSATNPNAPACLGTQNNTALGSTIPAFKEYFVGNTWKPRLAIGIGVNWNSPFGPFRIDFSKVLLKQDGDDTKTFTFNVGTQF